MKYTHTHTHVRIYERCNNIFSSQLHTQNLFNNHLIIIIRFLFHIYYFSVWWLRFYMWRSDVCMCRRYTHKREREKENFWIIIKHHDIHVLLCGVYTKKHYHQTVISSSLSLFHSYSNISGIETSSSTHVSSTPFRRRPVLFLQLEFNLRELGRICVFTQRKGVFLFRSSFHSSHHIIHNCTSSI